MKAKIIKSNHSNVFPGTIVEVIKEMPGGFEVKVAAKDMTAYEKFFTKPKDTTVFVPTENLELCNVAK